MPTGNARIQEGLLRGLSGLRRTGDAKFGPSFGKEPNSVDFLLGVDDLKFTSMAKFSFLGLSQSSPLIVTVKHVEVNIKAFLEPTKSSPTIREVSVLKLEGVEIELPGLGAFSSRFFGLIGKAFVSAFKGSIKGFIERGIVKAANFGLNRSGMRLG